LNDQITIGTKRIEKIIFKLKERTHDGKNQLD